MAATAVATAARASPRPRDRPAINWSAASAATGRRMPGKNATPMASADPIPTTKRKEEPGEPRPKAASSRSATAGRTASATSTSIRPSENAQKTVAQSE